jgi:hypothetical protein
MQICIHVRICINIDIITGLRIREFRTNISFIKDCTVAPSVVAVFFPIRVVVLTAGSFLNAETIDVFPIIDSSPALAGRLMSHGGRVTLQTRLPLLRCLILDALTLFPITAFEECFHVFILALTAIGFNWRENRRWEIGLGRIWSTSEVVFEGVELTDDTEIRRKQFEPVGNCLR